jgi:hypothetical protein
MTLLRNELPHLTATRVSKTKRLRAYLYNTLGILFNRELYYGECCVNLFFVFIYFTRNLCMFFELPFERKKAIDINLSKLPMERQEGELQCRSLNVSEDGVF